MANLALTVLVVALLIVALRALIRDWPFAVWGFVVFGFFVLFAPFDFKGQNGIEPRYLFPLLLGLQLAVAAFLAGLAPAWLRQGRPGTASLRLTAWPAGTPPRGVDGQLVLSRPHIQLAVGWAAA